MEKSSSGGAGLWAIVLAAGKGSRLRGITTLAGEAVPKQFCALHGDVSMLRRALQRAARRVPVSNIQVVVATEHRKWWERELEDLPASSVVAQPADRGTAAGVLLPLTPILRQDPDGIVVLLPADHHVGREWVLQEAIDRALVVVRAAPEKVALLGMTPEDGADPDYGWILPVPGHPEGFAGPAAVERFREKPGAAEAAALWERGGLVNSFVLVARARTLQALYAERLGELDGAFRRWQGDQPTLRRIYQQIPSHDFSRHLIEPSVDRLWVMPVPPCGWSDLGTPERVARCLESPEAEVAAPTALLPPRPGFVPPVDLSRRLAPAHRVA